MDQDICGCCASDRPVQWLFRRRRAVRGDDREFTVPGDITLRHPLCHPCMEWTVEIVDHLGVVSSASSTLLGTPGAWSRIRVFPDQCHLCKEMLGDHAMVIDSIPFSGLSGGMQPNLICEGCDIWLAGLVSDGRSARGEAERSIDGVYGMWPHPNLRSLAVELMVSDEGAATAIRESCRRMGVPVVEGFGTGAVLFVRATETGGASAILKDDTDTRPGRIVLAGLATKKDLLRCLDMGATTWLTIPVTPQQVSAALTRVMLRQAKPTRWDPQTALPIVDLEYLDRPALVIEPAPGVSPYEAAWFTRRVSRGYDDMGVQGSRIILVPRVAPASFDRVQARLAAALDGRCFVSPLQGFRTSRPLLEAAG